MELSQLVSKPQLVKITLTNIELPLMKDGSYVKATADRQKIDPLGKKLYYKTLTGPSGNKIESITTEKTNTPVMIKAGDYETYYEPEIVFWTHDRHSMQDYLQLSLNLNKDQGASVELLQKLILDSEGKQIISEGKVPPIAVQVAAMAEVMSLLGK